MPIYNCELYINEAIDSILNQTFADFELLLIDDCSTDTTLGICKSYEDIRIVIIEKEQNSGYTDSLNYGLSIAKGEYIARMDGDDISLPTRFEKQITFLNQNHHVKLCGTAFQFIGRDKIVKHPTNHEEIKVKLCFNTAFCHPSIMARKEIFKLNLYDKNFEPAEDYDLWSRLVFQVNLANLPEVLLRYRVHEKQISNEKNAVQIFNSYLIRKRIFSKLLSTDVVESTDFRIFLNLNHVNSIGDCKKVVNITKIILENNNTKNVFNKVLFFNKLHEHRNILLKRYITKSIFYKKETIWFMLTDISVKEFIEIFVFRRLNIFK